MIAFEEFETSSEVLHARIPTGVSDYFWSEAYDRRELEARILHLFRLWGYNDVIPPMFEFSETFTERSDAQLAEVTYRFLDRDGSTLALRVDMTIPIARLVGTRLYDMPMPQRFCYGGSVFRYVDPQAGRQREFYQAGLELYGAQSPQADAEVVALTSLAVEAAGIDDYQLVLGHIQYFDALVQEMHLSKQQNAQLNFAIERNSEAHLTQFLSDTPLTTQQRRTVEELPTLRGQDSRKILDRAESLCLNRSMYESVENLRQICEDLACYGIGAHIYVDLTEIHDLGYYTGLTFEVLTPQQGSSLGGGGRYDSLLASFGHALPAVGVALGLDRLLLANRLQRAQDASVRRQLTDVLVGAHGNPQCHLALQRLRHRNVRIAGAIDVAEKDALLRLAREHHIAHILLWSGDGFNMLHTEGDNEWCYAHHSEIDKIMRFLEDNATSAPPMQGAYNDD